MLLLVIEQIEKYVSLLLGFDAHLVAGINCLPALFIYVVCNTVCTALFPSGLSPITINGLKKYPLEFL